MSLPSKERCRLSRGLTAALTAIVLGTLLGCAGCVDSSIGPKVTAPGKESVEQAMAALEDQADGMKSLQLTGQCHLGFFDEDGKRREHNVSYNLWLDPPSNVYLQGRAVPGNRGLIFMGSNAEEFWLAIQPEINTYWWGRWVDVGEDLFLQLSPHVILEALGVVHFQSPEHWILTHRDGTDVLVEQNSDGKIMKRIRVSTSDYLIRRITYFDEQGEAVVVVDLGIYKYLGGILLPTEIQIANYADRKVTDSAKFSVRDARERQYSPEQFIRREPVGYDKVWQYTADGFVAAQ